MARVTIRDVAREAGVSVTTVSQALNRPEGSRVAEGTRRTVREVARRLGYRANPSARALRTSRTDTIALIGRDLVTTEFLGGLIRGAQEEVRRHDGLLIVADTGDDGDAVVRTLRDRRVDGIILGAYYHQELSVPRALHGVPTVLVNAFTTEAGYSWVVPDEQAGGRAAAEVLLAAGHRRVAMIGNRDDIPAASGRRRGFGERCLRSGVEPVIVDCAPTAEATREAALVLLSGPERPTGVFCFSDTMAIGMYFAAAALGLRIPQDVSVIGFDAMPLIDRSLTPPLTSVALPHAEMAAWAVERLYEQLEGAGGAGGGGGAAGGAGGAIGGAAGAAGGGGGTAAPLRHERIVGRVVEAGSVAAPPPTGIGANGRRDRS